MLVIAQAFRLAEIRDTLLAISGSVTPFYLELMH